jgi:hypothetical protein
MRKQKRSPRQSGKNDKQQSSGKRRMSSEEDEKQRDLQSREYRDAQGNIHHHTRKWMEQHRGQSRGKNE